MKTYGISLRISTRQDYHITQSITREAFWNHHSAGCVEHYLLHIMRSHSCFIPELDFIAEFDGKPAGHIAYTKARIVSDDGAVYPVLTFGPLSVLPKYQSRGVGKALVSHTLSLARTLAHSAVFIYGDPSYYARLGFAPAEKYKIGSSDNMYADALQAYILLPDAFNCTGGRFFEDSVFDIDEVAAAKFDTQFPPLELLSGLPSQKRFSKLVQMRKPM